MKVFCEADHESVPMDLWIAQDLWVCPMCRAGVTCQYIQQLLPPEHRAPKIDLIAALVGELDSQPYAVYREPGDILICYERPSHDNV